MQRFKILILFAFISFGFINSYSSDTQVKIGDKVYTIIEKNALDSLEAHNQTLQVKIDSTNNRINDFFIWIPSMVVLIIVLLGVNFFGGRHAARKQAKEELKDLRDKIGNLEEKAILVDVQYNELNTAYTQLYKLRLGDSNETNK